MTQNESQDFRCFPTEIPKKYIHQTHQKNATKYSSLFNHFLLSGAMSTLFVCFRGKSTEIRCNSEFSPGQEQQLIFQPFFFLLEQLVPAAEFWCNGKRALCENWSFEDAQTCSEFPWLHLMKLRKKGSHWEICISFGLESCFSTNFHSRHDSKKSRVTLSKFSNSVRA